MPDVNQAVSPDSSAVPRFRDAYAHLKDEIRAVPDSSIIHINIDIPTAVTTALGALPEITALRSRIADELPRFDIARFDKLEAYTLAAGQAQALFLAASAPTESIDQLMATAGPLRETLVSDASALATRGLVDRERLKELKGPQGFRNVAFDLLTLAALLRDRWPQVTGKTALQLAELDDAERLADRIATAVGLREQGPSVVAESADIRQRAFALFVAAYDHARRAISYLRWNEGDIEQIAPSLYAGRTVARRRPDPEPAAPATTVTGTAATNGPTQPVAPAVGLPGSDPFVRK